MNNCKFCGKESEKRICDKCQQEENDLLMDDVRNQKNSIDMLFKVMGLI